jgi:hypothetical protein
VITKTEIAQKYKAQEIRAIVNNYEPIGERAKEILAKLIKFMPIGHDTLLIGDFNEPKIPVSITSYGNGLVAVRTLIKFANVMDVDHLVEFYGIGGEYYPVFYLNGQLNFSAQCYNRTPTHKSFNYPYYAKKQKTLAKFADRWLANAYSNLDLTSNPITFISPPVREDR